MKAGFSETGSFITDVDGGMTYNGGVISELPGVDTDTLDVLFVRDYHKNIGYDKVTQTWWLVPNRLLQNGLRAITNDKERLEMCYLAQQNKGVIHVYYEYGVSEPLYCEEAEPVSSKGKELMVIHDLNHTPNPTTNVTAEPIFTTTPYTPTSEPNDTTIPTKKIVSTTKSIDNLSLEPKQNLPPPPAAIPPATSQPATNQPSHPMQGASQGTVTRLANFMKFVPNPEFRPPKNKNEDYDYYV